VISPIKEALGKLLRYESSRLDQGKLTSLADYVKRMPSDQQEIYLPAHAEPGGGGSQSVFRGVSRAEV
jgi:HSP90 family molecular chaperone